MLDKYLMKFICASTVPNGHDDTKELEVYEFTGAGGIALSMYNTDEVCILVVLFIFVHEIIWDFIGYNYVFVL